MKIIHQISFNTFRHPRLKNELNNLGVKFKVQPIGNNELIQFEISESDVRWFSMKDLFESVSDIVHTEFSKKEISEAEWARIISINNIGYPQPEDTWISEPRNYEIICPGCGIFNQISKFDINFEPNLIKTDFFSLHWATPLLCTNEVVQEIGKHLITGYKFFDVGLYDKNKISDKIKQIKVNSVLTSGFRPNRELPFNICESCGIKKFHPHNRGIMKFDRTAIDRNDTDFVLSNEWFGEGKAAFREILISSKLKEIILKYKWKGLSFLPIELHE